MIFRFTQFVDDKFQVLYNDTYIGTFNLFIKGKERCLTYNAYTDQNTVQYVAQAIKSIFPYRKIIVRNNYDKFVVDNNDKTENNFVLLHYNNNKPHESLLYKHGKRIGTFFKNRKHIVLDTTEGDKEYMGTFLNNVADAAYQLVKLYNQDIKVVLDGRVYVITPQTPYTHILSIFDNSVLNCWHKGKVVGTYNYAGRGLNFISNRRVPLRQSLDGALSLSYITKRPVCVLSQNETDSLLFKLYRRELCKKH